MYYSHSFEDPATGQVIDVMVDGDEPEQRNAGPRDHRGGDPRAHGSAPPWRHPGHPGVTFHPRPPHGQQQGTGIPSRVIVRGEGTQPGRTVPAHPADSGDYFVIRKDAIAEAITFIGPAIGQVWASFLGQPEPPQAVGDDVIDRDNAAMHRDALAKHQQNLTRILALTDLAARAARLLFT